MSYTLRRGQLLRISIVVAAAFALAAVASAAEDAKPDKADKAAGAAKADEVPDGSPQELVDYIKKWQTTSPKGSTRTARQDDTKRIQKKVLAAADKLLALEPDEAATAVALRAEMDALTIFKELGDEKAGEKLKAVVSKFENDERPAVAAAVGYFRLATQAMTLDATDKDKVRAFLGKSMDFIGKTNLDVQMLPLVSLVWQLSQQNQEAEQLAQTARSLAIRCASSDDPKVAVNGAAFAMMTARLYTAQEKSDEALKCYEQVAKLLKQSDDESLGQTADKLEGAIRQLKLLGNPIDIKGTLVDGKKFDWSKYKGKVVLVDFWATWCGPCVAELPNVKEVYEKHHDQGFDVIGISLDDDREALEGFLEKEHIHWPILFSSDPEATGWEHPMAAYYGVSAIPATFLVDRQGKVVSLEARGEKLGELVAELIDAK